MRDGTGVVDTRKCCPVYGLLALTVLFCVCFINFCLCLLRENIYAIRLCVIIVYFLTPPFH